MMVSRIDVSVVVVRGRNTQLQATTRTATSMTMAFEATSAHAASGTTREGHLSCASDVSAWDDTRLARTPLGASSCCSPPMSSEVLVHDCPSRTAQFLPLLLQLHRKWPADRSEERRVGKECRSG